MKRCWTTYFPRVTRPTEYYAVGTLRRTDHLAVGIERQLKPNSSPPRRHEKTEIKQLGDIHMNFGRTWIVEQDIQDRSTDREDVPRHATTTIYSDVTSLVTPEPKTADGLHRSYIAMWPNIEAPHTLSASQTR